MSKGTVTILAIAVVAIAVAVGLSAMRYFLNRDYLVHGIVECNPQIESCFIGDGVDLPEHYKEIEKSAKNIPGCDAWAGECEPLSCGEGEEGCREVLCEPSEETACSVPAE